MRFLGIIFEEIQTMESTVVCTLPPNNLNVLTTKICDFLTCFITKKHVPNWRPFKTRVQKPFHIWGQHGLTQCHTYDQDSFTYLVQYIDYRYTCKGGMHIRPHIINSLTSISVVASESAFWAALVSSSWAAHWVSNMSISSLRRSTVCVSLSTRRSCENIRKRIVP